jgi:hypothetical protein
VAESFYDLLGITPKVTREELRAAFFKRAARVHPLNEASANSERFQLFAEAFAILYDAKARFRYDAHLKSISTEAFRIPLNDNAAADLFNSIAVEVAYVHARAGKSMDEIADALELDGCPAEIAETATELAMEPIYAQATRKQNGRVLRTIIFFMMCLAAAGLGYVRLVRARQPIVYYVPCALVAVIVFACIYYRMGAPLLNEHSRFYGVDDLMEPTFRNWPGRRE